MSFNIVNEEISDLSSRQIREVAELYKIEKEKQVRINSILERITYLASGISIASGIAIFIIALWGYAVVQPAGYALGVILIFSPAVWAAYKYMEPGSIGVMAEFLGKTASIGAKFGVPFSFTVEKPLGVSEIGDLKKKISDLEQRIVGLSEEQVKPDYSVITNELAEKVYQSAAIELVASVERRLNIIERTDLYKSRHAMESIARTRTRMSSTLEALNSRGAVNLLLGGAITCVGATLLYKFVLVDVVSTSDPIAYALHFLPRLTIVGIIQVFALFFLKLYKLGLEEIKYFQNEMTNIEQRELALSVALLQDDTSVRSSILELIAATDRNNVLQKGQSTIEIEKARVENSGGALETLKNIIPILIKQK